MKKEVYLLIENPPKEKPFTHVLNIDTFEWIRGSEIGEKIVYGKTPNQLDKKCPDIFREIIWYSLDNDNINKAFDKKYYPTLIDGNNPQSRIDLYRAMLEYLYGIYGKEVITKLDLTLPHDVGLIIADKFYDGEILFSFGEESELNAQIKKHKLKVIDSFEFDSF